MFNNLLIFTALSTNLLMVQITTAMKPDQAVNLSPQALRLTQGDTDPGHLWGNDSG